MASFNRAALEGGTGGSTGGTDSQSSGQRKRREPEDSIREKSSASESDPMTDVGSTSTSSAGPVVGDEIQVQDGDGGGDPDPSPSPSDSGADTEADSGSDVSTGPPRPSDVPVRPGDESTTPSDSGSETAGAPTGVTPPTETTSSDMTSTSGPSDRGMPPGLKNAQPEPQPQPEPRNQDVLRAQPETPDTPARGSQPGLESETAGTRNYQDEVTGLEQRALDQLGAGWGPEDVKVVRRGDTFQVVLTAEGQQQQRQQLEQRALSQLGAEYGREDVDVVQEGGELVANLTLAGRRQRAAESLDSELSISVTPNDIQIRDGSVSLTPDARERVRSNRRNALVGIGYDVNAQGEFQAPDAAGQRTLAEQQQRDALVGLGYDVTASGDLQAPEAAGQRTLTEQQAAEQRVRTMEGLGFEGSGDDLRAPDTEGTPNLREQAARQQIERQLEEQTGVSFTQDQITYRETEDGITGRLNDEGRKRLAVQTAPGQGIPVVESLTEFTAGVDYEFDEFRAENRELANTVDTWNDITPNVGVEQTWNRITPDGSALTGLATAAVPFAAAEPTPAGEVATGTLFAAGALLTTTAAVGASTQTGRPEASEISVPKDGEFFPGGVDVPSQRGLFVDEVPTPDPSQIEFFGVPEQGITIPVREDARTSVLGKSEIPISDDPTVLPSNEVDVPTSGEETPGVRAQELVQREGQRSRDRSRPKSRDEGVSVPEELLPDDEIVIGRERDLPQPSREGRVNWYGRQYDPTRVLEDTRKSFFEDVDTTGFVEAGEQSLAADAASPPQLSSGPLLGVSEEESTREESRGLLGSQQQSGPAVDVDALTIPGQESATDAVTQPTTAAPTTPATPTAPTSLGAEFGFPEQSLPQYEVGYPVGGDGDGRRRLRLDFTLDEAGETEAGTESGATDWFVREFADPLGRSDGSGSGLRDSII